MRRWFNRLAPYAATALFTTATLTGELVVNLLASGTWSHPASAIIFAAAAAVGIAVDSAKNRLAGQSLGVSNNADGRGDQFQSDQTVSLAPPLGLLPAHTIGREAEIAEVLRGPLDHSHFTVITGMGGIGKTTIALVVAEEAIERMASQDFVWWVKAKDSEGLHRAMLAIGHQLGITQDELLRANLGLEKLADIVWRHLERHLGWVLVFDNIDDLRILSPGDANEIREGTGWLRASRSGQVIVTSRLRDPEAWGSRARIVSVDALTEADGAELLILLAPSGGGIESARMLSDRLYHVPLALRQAALYIRSPYTGQSSFQSYREALSTDFPELLRPSSEGGDENPRASVMATWALSARWLEDQGRSSAVHLLYTFACFPPGLPILEEIVLGMVVRPPRRLMIGYRTRTLLEKTFNLVGSIVWILVWPAALIAQSLRRRPNRLRNAILYNMIRGQVRVKQSLSGLKADLSLLESIGLIDVFSSDQSDLVPGVVMHPLIQEALWRESHQPEKHSRRSSRRARSLARRASNAVAVGAILLDGLEMELAHGRWPIFYDHIAEILRFESGGLKPQELADLIVAGANTAASVTLASIPNGFENTTFIISEGPGLELDRLLTALARRWGYSDYMPGVWRFGLDLMNPNRYHEVTRGNILWRFRDS